MRMRRFLFASLFLCLFACLLSAQLPPVKTDPLRPTQIIQGSGACSATEPSSCAQAAAKITPIVMGDSPLESNLRHLTDDIGGRVSGSPEMGKAVEWGGGGVSRGRRGRAHGVVSVAARVERGSNAAGSVGSRELSGFACFFGTFSGNAGGRHRGAAGVCGNGHSR